MAKYIVHTCDRCGCNLTSANWTDDDEICNDCILLIEVAQQIARDALIQHKTPKQIADQWFSLYQQIPEAD